MHRFSVAALVLSGLAAAPIARAVDLEGTWHVLVHYRDESSPAPEKWRWDDRVWEFQSSGRRVRWVEYPIVVFKNESGRFERRRGQYARVVHAWEPNASQLAEIRQGLAVNTRGSKKKTLKGSDAQGWRSAGGPLSGSASVVSYSETWSIQGLPEQPVFEREDSLSSGRLEGMAGRTEYHTEEVLEDGNLLVGSYERDGTRHGRFRIRRAGSVVGVGSRSQAERQREALIQTIQASPGMRQLVKEELQSALSESGISFGEKEFEALVDEAVGLVSQGFSEQEIALRLQASALERYFAFAKRGAKPDDSQRYRLPFASDAPRRLTRGVGEAKSASRSQEMDWVLHSSRFRYGFDFDLPVGTPVLAARAGTVTRTADGFTEGGQRKELATRANGVTVLHDDGSFAVYTHLSRGLEVKPEQRVAAGDLLGQSGDTGYTELPKLHFAVLRLDAKGELESVAIRFDDGSSEGFVPIAGRAYGGAGASAEAASRPEARP
jgi:murein DD-endopeptidase MepM/ murein hydrolase activator NlpD